MGKHRFLTNDKSNGKYAADHSAPGTKKNFKGKRNNFKNRSNIPNIHARPQEPTPWLKLKEAFLEQEKELNAKRKLENDQQAKKKTFLKDAKEKQKEETIWEDFSGTPDADNSGKEVHQAAYNSRRHFTLNGPPERLSENTKNFFRRFITARTSAMSEEKFLSPLDYLKRRNEKNDLLKNANKRRH